MNILKGAGLAGLLAIAGSAAFAQGKPGAEDAASPPLWSRQCVKEADREVCYVEQYAVAMPANTVLLNVRLGYFGPEGRPRMIVTVPIGVLLAPGLGMSIDAGKPVTLPFESCQPGGCRAVVDMDQATLDQIRRGARLTMRFVGADRKALDIPVSLKGVDAALKQLRK